MAVAQEPNSAVSKLKTYPLPHSALMDLPLPPLWQGDEDEEAADGVQEPPGWRAPPPPSRKRRRR